jgi:uncharacterized protein YkwD
MRNQILLFLLFSACAESFGQASTMAREIFKVINEARTDPKTFLSRYQNAIEKINPAYIEFLRTAEALNAVTWDSGLEAMAKTVVENGALDPAYNGKATYCGFSWGNGSGNIKKESLNYVIDLYPNVHGPDYAAFAIYFNAAKTGFSYQWGRSCTQKKMEFPAPPAIDTSKVNFFRLNTGLNATYMQSDEKRMLLEINFVRAHPSVYALLVEQYLHDQSQSPFGLDSDDYQAGTELIAELRKLNPMPILQPDQCVYKAARAHGLDSQRRGFFSHTGSDKSDPWDRILKECPQYTTGNENGVGGFSTNPRNHVISLLIDSGVPSRGHRYNMLNPSWKFGACFRYDDKKYKNFWVQNFAH